MGAHIVCFGRYRSAFVDVYLTDTVASDHRLASTVFQHFVAADTASESFASLKRIHGLMPYFMLKTILKISNPMAMIRGQYCSCD